MRDGHPGQTGGATWRRATAGVLTLSGVLGLWPEGVMAAPLSRPEVLRLVRRNVQEQRLLAVVRELGMDFRITVDVVDELRVAGATSELIEALKMLGTPAEVSDAVVSPPPPPAAPTLAAPPPARPAVMAVPLSPPAAAPSGQSASPPPVPSSESPVVTPPPAPPPPPEPGVPARPSVAAVLPLIPAPPPPPPPGSDVLFPRPALPEPRDAATAPVPLSPPAPPAAGGAKTEVIKPLLERARALRVDGDIRAAQELVAKAMEIDPGDPDVWRAFKEIEQDILVRAETWLDDGQVARALRDFEFVIRTNPESDLGHYGKGLALLKLKNYDGALEALQRAVSLNPGKARYRLTLKDAQSLQRANRALERQGQENLQQMLTDPAKKKGP